MPRMYDKTRRLVDYDYIVIFIRHVQGDIFGNNVIFIGRAVHRERNDIQRLHLITALHRLAIGQHKTCIGCLLNTVARGILDTVEQVFVYPHHLLAFVHHHAEMLVQLGCIACGRLQVIQFVIQYLVLNHLYH